MKKFLKMQCIGNQQLQQQRQQQQQHNLHKICLDKIKTKISTPNNYVNGGDISDIGQHRHQEHQNQQHIHELQKFSNKNNLLVNEDGDNVLVKKNENDDVVVASHVEFDYDEDVDDDDDGSDNKLEIDLNDERSYSPQITQQQQHLPNVIITKANNCTSGGLNGGCIQQQFTQQQQQQVRVIKDGRLYESECRGYMDQGTTITTTAKVAAKLSPIIHPPTSPPRNQVNVIASGITSDPIKTGDAMSNGVPAAGTIATPSTTAVATTSTSIFRPPVVSSTSAAAMRPPPPPPPLTKLKSTSPEEPSSSIPDLEFDGTTVLCRVCGDKASGFHYGVHSCEGCKGFFRRSIQQKIQYRPCTKNQQCSILRINRNRCQYCRLKKCIAVGMSRDAVRFGRVPKREKARILAAMQQSTQNRGQQRQLATELDDQPRLLAAVLRAHMETCEFTKDKVQAMRQRARDCPSYSMPTLACPLNPAPELQSEQEFSQRFAHVIRGVIDFAGMIPGFQLLTQDDKFTLLKAGLFDALFVRLICMFDSSINSIICLNGQVMRRDSIQNGANARFLVDSTFNFAERMNHMVLTDAEIGLFCAIVLITPDRPGLRNIELIEKMYNKLKQCLQTIITQNRPDQPDFMHDLLKTMPDLRTLSTLHTEKLVVFRTEHKELLRQQMWSSCDEEGSSVAGKSPAGSSSSWGCDIGSMEDVAKSPMGSVSSTESGDTSVSSEYSHQSSLTSSAPLLAATLAGGVIGGCPIRLRANSSGSSAEDDMMLGGHTTSSTTHIGTQSHCVSASTTVAATAHLVAQNGLTITPVVRQISPPTNSTAAGVTTATSSTSPAGVTISQQQHHHIRYRKLDSPTDSGIESGNEKNDRDKNASSGGSSSCSSPRSSVEDATEEKRHIVEDMPVLKRVLQAPPLYDTNSLMDEAYKPHKKFRAMRHRESEAEAAESSTSSTSITPISMQTSSSATSSMSSAIQQHTSQLHMHLTRPTNVTTAGHNHSTAHLQQQQQLHNSMQQQLHLQQQHHQHQSASPSPNNILHHHLTATPTTNITITQPHHQPQQQQSTLSSTHSVLAKSLMEEPRMTPEQIKRSDIIQNYIMRESAAEQHHHQQQQHKNGLLVVAGINSGSTTITPANGGASSTAQCPFASSSVAARWHTPSVITTTGRQQLTPSPSSSEQSSSRYFQSPHSTSSSVSPPGPSPSSSSSSVNSIGLISSPRLIELQVDIADTQQPLNLSKKSPSPIPIAHRVGTTTTIVHPHQQATIVPVASTNATMVQQHQQQQQQQSGPSATTSVVHKVLLEA